MLRSQSTIMSRSQSKIFQKFTTMSRSQSQCKSHGIYILLFYTKRFIPKTKEAHDEKTSPHSLTHVCMYTCMYVYMYVCIYMHISSKRYIYCDMYVYICMQVRASYTATKMQKKPNFRRFSTADLYQFTSWMYVCIHVCIYICMHL